MGVLTAAQWGALWEEAPDRLDDRMDAFVALIRESLGQATAVNILDRLIRRSGDLLSSVDTEVTRNGSLISIALTVGKEGGKAGAYAKVQDEGSGYLPGGVIRPRRAQYLAIPVPIGRGGATSPRDLPDDASTQWIPRAGGGFFVVHNGAMVFVLVPEVRLQPTRYALDAFHGVADKEAVDQLGAVIEVLG